MTDLTQRCWCPFKALTVTWHDGTTTVYSDKEVLSPHGSGDICIKTSARGVDHIPFSYVKSIAVDATGKTEHTQSIYADWS